MSVCTCMCVCLQAYVFLQALIGGYSLGEGRLEMESSRPVFVSRLSLVVTWKIYSISTLLRSLSRYSKGNNSCSILELLEFQEL